MHLFWNRGSGWEGGMGIEVCDGHVRWWRRAVIPLAVMLEPGEVKTYAREHERGQDLWWLRKAVARGCNSCGGSTAGSRLVVSGDLR